MKFFIDTAKVEDIKAANDMGVTVVLPQIRLLSQKKEEISRK